MNKARPVKKFYSLEETEDLLSSNNELEKFLKNDDPDQFTSVPETDDSIVKTSEGGEEDLHVFSELEDADAICSEALSLVQGVNEIFAHKDVMRYDRDSSTFHNNDYDGEEYVPEDDDDDDEVEEYVPEDDNDEE